MNSLHPISASIGELAQACLCITFAVYTLRLPDRTRNNWLLFFVLFIATLGLFSTFIYDCNIDDTPYAIYGEWAIMFFRYMSTCYGLWVAYQFYGNPFHRESVAVVSLCTGLCCLSLFLWFQHYQPLVPQPAYNVLLELFIFIAQSVYAGIIYLRKAKVRARNVSLLSNTEERNATLRTVSFFRTYALISFIFCAIWLCFLLPSFNLISWFAWDCISYILIMSALTTYFYMYLYSQDTSLFQAKLVGVILFVVLIIVGIIPLLLFGDTRFITISEKEQGQIDIFVILVPLTTLFIAIILPVLFRRVILKQLNHVIAAVRSVNEGNLSAQVAIDSNDEIGNLSYHFNRMTTSLQRYADKMNELVDERTSALNQSLQELKSTQAQLIQSEKMASLGELTAGIAHEIQNPLNFVNNFSEVNNELIEEMNAETDVEEIKAIAADIKQNNEKIAFHGRRADAIVKGMLQHSRKNNGVKESTDINALCDEYIRLGYHGLKAKDRNFNADFTTAFDENIGRINIIPQDMGRVLLNLINNAFYAVNEKKKTADKNYKPLVSVSTKKVNDKVEIIITDNGSGIPQHIIDKIFQPFFTTKPTGEGTGLGLSLSYDIITKEHGGMINVESEENSFTKFIITIPS